MTMLNPDLRLECCAKIKMSQMQPLYWILFYHTQEMLSRATLAKAKEKRLKYISQMITAML